MVNFSSKFKFRQYKLVFLIVIFFLAILVWCSPIIFKGYSFYGISRDTVLARNYYQSGVLATQNDLNVTLAPDLVKEEGHSLILSEHLGAFFYAQIFKLTDIPSHNNLILISISLYALVLVLFTILVLRLFNFKIAAVFSLIYIFSPIGWSLAYKLGGYEFCLLFWALFFIFYFLGIKKTKQFQNKFTSHNSFAGLNNFFFVISGIFLAFSVLSMEVTLVFALAFFIFLLIKKFWSQLLYIFVPFAVLLIVFWLPSIISGENRYMALIPGYEASEESVFSVYTHVFPDSYTYYFEKEEFLEKIRNQNLDIIEDLQLKKDLANFGFARISFFERIKIGFYLSFQHLSRFFSLEDFGGPFILLLWILGMIYLKRKKAFLYRLFLYWISISLFVFSFVLLLGRNHLMDFIWPIILGIVLGLFYILDIVKNHFKIKDKKALILNILIIGLVLYSLVLINHVVLGRRYDGDSVPRSMAYAQEIEKLEIESAEAIAIPGDFPGQIDTLNYLTNKSFVIFRSSTLDELLKEDKINQALDTFGVKYILGYSDELSDRIVAQTEAVNIAPNSLKVEPAEVSEIKSFFMNIIR